MAPIKELYAQTGHVSGLFFPGELYRTKPMPADVFYLGTQTVDGRTADVYKYRTHTTRTNRIIAEHLPQSLIPLQRLHPITGAKMSLAFDEEDSNGRTTGIHGCPGNGSKSRRDKQICGQSVQHAGTSGPRWLHKFGWSRQGHLYREWKENM
jgi:hypothetical protein